jgi:hypothetical protein
MLQTAIKKPDIYAPSIVENHNTLAGNHNKIIAMPSEELYRIAYIAHISGIFNTGTMAACS